ncbi:HI0074 family nucleotidyltransferase substrate-binding subunit [Thermosynechococcus sp. PP45]|uniref:HI0074 family nucleotidyltransferase substrate-binding subunit n=1 Tax=unclassified Thermosynechococcus TaxID=2622553 RepID=UPI002670E9B4|nr:MULTISPECIES: HI0074 family nucleotidyltransferase substrate-binding subunit [unclassified Thermosynechococcus]MDR5639018.1 HI0074 family nucleotidyltransferase substrate-binding subunit [Thermosynechococcus sp. PP42]WKT80379.1 HI0074 family nucleotidyltransferase substrate-binding subunit [Thermosynechococcus sp. PP45]WNC23989.1 HI0074 family nucleotidyltransferase substrate-binding subunit [Thermosynechococcus sp. PP551]WNC26567.1 HI0074 family nucleotidyltransferase substrate-binding subu
MTNRDAMRWQQRLQNFGRVLIRLETACAQEEYSELERAGLVQMFEFTLELAWKTLKDLLFYEGLDVKTPREAIRKAFETGYLTEEDTEILLDALAKRNLLSHTYEEQTTKEAERLIKHRLTPVFRKLYNCLQEKYQQ